MYVNAELQNQYATIVDDFRKSAKYVLARDMFFENVLNYDRSFSTFQSSSTQLSCLLASIESNLATCLDSQNDTSNVDGAFETGHLNLGELEKSETLTTTLADCIYTKKCGAFDMKMIKLWIQTYLDKYLNQLDKALSTVSFEELDSVKASTDASFERLKYFLDVLFFFERHKDSSDPAVSNPDTSFAQSKKCRRRSTPQQERAAYLDDRRNTGFSVLDGLGPLAPIWINLTGTTTSITSMPDNAVNVSYTDSGINVGLSLNANPKFGLVAKFNSSIGTSGSTEPH
ncbi:hypothetical protein HDU80_007817 [Chytriomyces hyalinus]|nr:hypothetical protein HDU80_007817 [Chytriomyces hyalinus]